MARTLVELADTLVDDFDVVELLTTLANRCVEVLDITAAGIMLASPAGHLRTVASSNNAMLLLELFEEQADEGPCSDAFRSGSAVVHDDLADGSHPWPAFGPRAAGAGFRSAAAVPLRLRHQTVGALNMFRHTPGPLDDADVTVAQAFADAATIAILQHRAVEEAQALNVQLQQALNSRIVIEQAKGIISESLRTDMEDAFRLLRTYARSNNLRLSDVAARTAEKSLSASAFAPFHR